MYFSFNQIDFYCSVTDDLNQNFETRNEIAKLIETNNAMSAKLDQVVATNGVLVREFSKLSVTVQSLVSAVTGKKNARNEQYFSDKV